MSQATHRILVTGAILGGPALMTYAASDRLYLEPFIARLLHDIPRGFFVAALWSYSVVLYMVRPKIGIVRLMLTLVGSVFLHILLWIAVLPLLFGIGLGPYPEIGFSIIAGIIAIIVGGFHKIVLRSGIPTKYEIPAHLCAMVGPPMIFLGIQSVPETRPLEYLFAGWPALIALLPYIFVVLAYSQTGLRVQHVIVVVFSVAPVYILKAASDYGADRGSAFLWPTRVADEFKTPKEPNAEISRVTRVRSGEPVHIGLYRYQFGRIRVVNPHPKLSPKPDRIQFLQIEIPKAALDIPIDVGPPGEWIMLDIGVKTPSVTAPKSMASESDLYVKAFYEDLTISVVRWRRDPRWPANESLEPRLVEFMRSIRLDLVFPSRQMIPKSLQISHCAGHETR